jgi:hypothetical protein
MNNNLRNSHQATAMMALSAALVHQNIEYAVIRGMALRFLGHDRETGDIDVEVNLAVSEVRQGILDCLKNDARFKMDNLRLYFYPEGENETSRILIEAIPIGELGLPTSLKTYHVEECESLLYLLQTCFSSSFFIISFFVLPSLEPVN